MATKNGNVAGSAAARSRRIIYLLSGITVALSLVAAFLLLSEPGTPNSSPPKAENPPPRQGESPPEPDTPTAGADTTDAIVAPPSRDPKVAALREANALFDAGIAHLRAAMNGTPGADETEEEKKTALDNLLKAQEAYEAYLEDYPEEESSLDRRMTDLGSQIFWCRKTMVASSFPSAGGESRPPRETTRPVEPRPETPRVRPEPAFRPEAEMAKFKAGAAQALKDGRPDRIFELGTPLLEDPRMEGRLGDIPEVVALALSMRAVLAAAQSDLSGQVGSEVDLALRDRTIRGLLRGVGEGIMVQAPDGVETIHISDLSAEEIVARAAAGGGLELPGERLAAGAYLVLRGDQEAGVAQLLMARAGGQDVAPYSHFIERALADSPELRALGDWVQLEPRIAKPDPELHAALEAFKADHRNTAIFAQRREELFKALGVAGEALEFELADLYHVLQKNPGKSVKLHYLFDDGDELLDFGTRGDWTVAEGALTGSKGETWIERFDLKSADLSFVLRSAAELNVVLWEGGWDLRGGLNLNLKPDPSGLIVTFHNGRKQLGREVVRMPKDEVEVHLQLKGDKFLLAINRKVILKGDGAERPPEKSPRILAFTVNGEPVRIDEIELKSDLDLEWAKAGGTHQALWIRDYHVTGPFTLANWQLEAALQHEKWPEVEPFDPGKADDQGNPVWHHVRIPDSRLDLNALKPSDRVFAYAVVRVWSPDRRTAILEIEADDAARAWLNDELIAEMVPLGEARRVNLKLSPGDNLLLLKVADEKSAFWLRTRLLTKSGERMPDVICW